MGIDRPKEMRHALQVNGTVFQINADPIKPECAQDLGDSRMSDLHPCTKNGSPLEQGNT
jgi:hypothetical protein